MSKETYSDKLLSPHWQRKRQDVLTRDNYSCVLCSDTETTLHVHHLSYTYGKEPWEYELDNFQTLCKHCHKCVEAMKIEGYTPIVSAKRVVSEEVHVTVISIRGSAKHACIYRFNYFDDSLEGVIKLSEKSLRGMIELFQLSEKLTTHAKPNAERLDRIRQD